MRFPIQQISFMVAGIVCMLMACGAPPKSTPTIHPFTPPGIPAKKEQVKLVHIAIAPYHDIDSSTTALIAHEFEDFYVNVKTSVLPNEIMPDSLLAWSKTRYNANKILRHLAEIKPGTATYILALTDDRIAACGDSIHETGVAGLGDEPGYCCVVSTAALQKNIKDSNQFNQRLLKACMHEMGHNFGLPHCKKNKKCLMRSSGGTILTLDEEDLFLCKHCRELLTQKGFIVKKKPGTSACKIKIRERSFLYGHENHNLHTCSMWHSPALDYRLRTTCS